MKFFIPMDEVENGGSIWLHHIGDTLKALGHEVDYKRVYQHCEDSDFVIIQSEWIEKTAYLTAKRAIVLLGHFTDTLYPDSTKLRPTDIVLTHWKGEVVEDWEKRSGLKAHYFPHAFFKEDRFDIANMFANGVWIGSETPFRDTSRLEQVSIDRLSSMEPKYVSAEYRAHPICPNIHLDIQKGKLDTSAESPINKAGYAVNERLFWIPGAMGFELADENPLIRDFYAEDEVPMTTNEDFKEKFDYYLEHPEIRKAMTKKAHERTMREHTYERRIKDILLPLCV